MNAEDYETSGPGACGPDMVRIALPYGDALRLAYMAQFPTVKRPEDQRIVGAVTAAITETEEAGHGS